MPQPSYERRRRANTAAGAVVGAYAAGLPASVGAQKVGVNAALRAQANEVKLKDAAPSYRKYEKVKNLADRGSTPGERSAAQGMADKLKAKAQAEEKAARKSIKGYRSAKALRVLANPKAALAAGFGGTAAAGAAIGRAVTEKPKKKKVATLAKRDYSVAQARWEGRERRANRVENTGQGVAGAAGTALGGAALRDAAFHDYPGFKQRMQLRSMDVPTKVGRKVAEAAMHGKPGLKTLGTVAAGTVVATAGTKAKKTAAKRARRLEEMSKMAEPGSLMHRADLAKSAAPMGNRELAHRKKVQSATTIAGSTLGLAAIGALGGAKLLPRATKLGKTPRGQAYARHLDRAATQLSIGAGGVGGVGGYNFAAIQRAEAKKVEPKTKVAKALSDRNLARTLNLAFNGRQQDTRIRATNLYMRAKTRGEKKAVPYAARKQKKVARVIERAQSGQKWSPVKGD